MNENILFCCPSCNAKHSRGFLDYVCLFRCLRCGYQGHGFHPEQEIDKELFEDHKKANTFNRINGLPEAPLGIDKLNGPG